MYHINHVSAKNTDLMANDTLVDFKPTSSGRHSDSNLY